MSACFTVRSMRTVCSSTAPTLASTETSARHAPTSQRWWVALSVAAARAGAETLTLDLSPRYLDRARENLRLNGIEPGDHDFVYGDAMEWMDRLARNDVRFRFSIEMTG